MPEPGPGNHEAVVSFVCLQDVRGHPRVELDKPAVLFELIMECEGAAYPAVTACMFQCHLPGRVSRLHRWVQYRGSGTRHGGRCASCGPGCPGGWQQMSSLVVACITTDDFTEIACCCRCSADSIHRIVARWAVCRSLGTDKDDRNRGVDHKTDCSGTVCHRVGAVGDDDPCAPPLDLFVDRPGKILPDRGVMFSERMVASGMVR